MKFVQFQYVAQIIELHKYAAVIVFRAVYRTLGSPRVLALTGCIYAQIYRDNS